MVTKRLAPFSYLEAVIESRKGNPQDYVPVKLLLSASGIPDAEQVFFENEKRPYLAFYTRSPQVLKKVEMRFRKAFPRGYRLKSRLLERNDWFDKWQLDYQMMPIGQKFMLVPLWQKDKFKGGKRVPIYLDPKGASGSGQHPTTQIMVEFIESVAGKYSDCLDLGTGTGILGIALAKCGGTRVSALDNDRVAVQSAKFNFELNDVPDTEVKLADVLKNAKAVPYSLVCANLISPVLDQIKKFLFASVKPGGYLLVSGVHVQNYPEFHKTFHNPKFRCLKILKKRGWTGMLFKRTR